VVTNEKINRAVYGALNKCLHEWIEDWNEWRCLGCDARRKTPPPPNTDYTEDKAACVDLMEECDLYDVVRERPEPTADHFPKRWIASKDVGGPLNEYLDGGFQDTFCLAICHAVIKAHEESQSC